MKRIYPFPKRVHGSIHPLTEGSISIPCTSINHRTDNTEMLTEERMKEKKNIGREGRGNSETVSWLNGSCSAKKK